MIPLRKSLLEIRTNIFFIYFLFSLNTSFCYMSLQHFSRILILNIKGTVHPKKKCDACWQNESQYIFQKCDILFSHSKLYISFKMVYDLLESDKKWLSYTRLNSKTHFWEKCFLKFPKQNHQSTLHCFLHFFLNINYYITDHNIIFFIFVTKNKNRWKTTTTVEQILERNK